MPVASVAQTPPPAIGRRALGRAGVHVTIRGRSLKLRGLHHSPTGVLAALAILGPGLVAAAAGDDAGGVATYSQVGAKYGYDLLWVVLLITVSLAVVQEMCARLGAATGRGLLDLIRERFGIGWALLAVGVIVIANGGVTITEFVGIGAAMELLGVSKYVAVPIAAVGLWYLVIAGSYSRVERLLLVLTLAFFAYPVAAILAHPDWSAVARGTFVPTLQPSSDYLILLVGLIGTTITPYMQLFQQSAVVEKGVGRDDYGPERADAYAGAAFGNLISAFIIIATAATLHVAGITDIQTAQDAAQALRPLAGDAALVLFAVGLLGASLIAGGVLPLATAYSVSEAFGFRKGVNLDFRRAPIFIGLYTVLVVVGSLVALVPGVPVIEVLVGVQVLNGILLPIILVFILILANDRRLTGALRNGRVNQILGWGTFALVTSAVVVLLGSQFLGIFGINILGS
ncbi:MAG: Nramp family divalent metal transporter [Chloroflexi bacterium]|nr:Nramp family divalent metal transporter [Chloroflexota bacterium]